MAAPCCRPPPPPPLPFAPRSLHCRSPAHPLPQNLVEYIARQKIYDSVYWKQDCFGLSAERLVDKAVELREVG